MSATRNAEAVEATASNPSQQFGSKIARDEPLTTKGHQPGVLATAADKAPEFHAESLPAGTAPSAKTHTPNPDPADQYEADGHPAASSTIPGATSADVHTGYGHPGSGQTSAELHGGKKRDRTGLEGVGATVGANGVR